MNLIRGGGKELRETIGGDGTGMEVLPIRNRNIAKSRGG